MAIKVAVIGMGGIGNTHAQCYVDNPLAELVAVCDINKEKADAAAEKFGVKAYYSIKDMLEQSPEIEAVSVTTSGIENGGMHFEPSMQCLDAGKHVLVEKPICADIDDARELVRFAASKKLYLGNDLNHYFTETAARAKKMQEDGLIGQLQYCICKSGFNGWEGDYRGKMSPRWMTPYSHLKAYCAHPFSVMRYFCGDIVGVQAFLDKPGVRASAEDPMLTLNSIHVKFANGGYGHLISQRGDSAWGYGGWWSYEHAGTKGTFAIENCTEKLLYWDPKKKDASGRPTMSQATLEPEIFDTGIKSFNATFPVRINAWLEDLTNKVHPEHIRASGRDALATLEYTFACIESYENGGALVVPHKLPAIHGDTSVIY